MKYLYSTAKEADFILEYYITEDDGKRGIEVIKKFEKKGILCTESCICAKVFWSKEGIMQAAAMLSRNTVTPVSLRDVMEDIG